MSMMDDRLEMLIGKLLDGEISPAEQRLLERELERNGRARELLEQMRVLHECSGEVVTHGILGGGADPGEVFERAWQQYKGSLRRRVVKTDGYLRFAVGLAAGFLLGLALHFVLVRGPETTPNKPSQPRIAMDVPWETDGRTEIVPAVESRMPREVTRSVDWYEFTDQTGNRWLVEGFREGVARPTAYYSDL
jgi:hypothetical protein